MISQPIDSVPLVLVHGFPMDHRMWEHQLDAFDGWITIAPDLLGFGQNALSPPATSIADYADDLVAMVKTRGYPKAVFTGLSMGGYILFEVLRRHPEQIHGLVFVCTRSSPDTELAARGRLEAKRRVESIGTQMMAEQMPSKLLSPGAAPDLVARLRTMIAEANPPGVIAALDAMRMRSDSTNLLGSIDVPTLLVAGADDEIVSPQEMQAMADDIPDARFVEIQNAGHVPPMEQPSVFNGVLREFLSDL